MASSAAQWIKNGDVIQVMQYGEKICLLVDGVTPDGFVKGKRVIYDSGNLWRVSQKQVIFGSMAHLGLVEIKQGIRLEQE